ncbi:F0F1 ATP synthase subunit B [Apilactobacillus xinyiensis]|uniref:ATP synthase subunit b n=1 Tax=Apilactobacillus xinyiensis TaxID=2841032 RepID=A0ABT0HZH0_9LACO|nr:F0F1 ATP synthase subunit B [Apilactobacillus xinyiensis]MCK8623977.1 F0F1 ATP synthase subunit B [Apilactobacillus xinyiensis]MCL0311569.1 F0F1 ATP synthase subunit B [Apilactobacillus xinyiensis]MCL0318286.1 F0F1 ATP synthase subunit B [Apilactobacillus xinyiensis]MCL0330054.1 F0F1 ATP synthase subunit B [Apilactobacillus xinyiensis]
MFSHLLFGSPFVLTEGLYTGNLLFTAFCFIILMGLIKHFAWGPLSEMMDKRANKIANDINSAEKSRQEAEKLAAQREEALSKSQDDASAIVNRAKDTAKQQGEQIVNSARTDAQSIKNSAQKEIEQERKDALANTKDDVANLSIEIASKIIQKELKADDQKALIDSYIEGLGKQNAR